jgi:hypothetical protein
VLKRDLDRRRRALAGQLMDSVDNSVAAGAKEFNVVGAVRVECSLRMA